MCDHYTKKESRESKQKRKSMSLQILRILYRYVKGKEISKEYRTDIGTKDNSSLTYGEIVPESFQQILDYISAPNSTQGYFFDIGCGSGKAVLCAALYSRCYKKVIGIEIVPPLYESACSAQTRLYHSFQSTMLSENPSTPVITKNSHSKPPTVSNDSFFSEISRLLLSQGGKCKIEYLAAMLCQQLGAKTYRNSLKYHKSLKNYLAKQPDAFTVEGDEVQLLGGERTESLSASPPLVTWDDPHDTTELPEGGTDECVDKEGTDQLASLLQSMPRSDVTALFADMPVVEFVQGDLFEVPWWTMADAVYVASLLFSDDMMLRLTALALRMRPGSWLVTLRPLSLEGVDADVGVDRDESDRTRATTALQRYESYFKMSWQMARVYFYQIMEKEKEKCETAPSTTESTGVR